MSFHCWPSTFNSIVERNMMKRGNQNTVRRVQLEHKSWWMSRQFSDIFASFFTFLTSSRRTAGQLHLLQRLEMYEHTQKRQLECLRVNGKSFFSGDERKFHNCHRWTMKDEPVFRVRWIRSQTRQRDWNIIINWQSKKEVSLPTKLCGNQSLRLNMSLTVIIFIIILSQLSWSIITLSACFHDHCQHSSFASSSHLSAHLSCVNLICCVWKLRSLAACSIIYFLYLFLHPIMMLSDMCAQIMQNICSRCRPIDHHETHQPNENERKKKKLSLSLTIFVWKKLCTLWSCFFFSSSRDSDRSEEVEEKS